MLLADQLRVGIEDRDDPEAVVGEDVGAGDRLAEVAGAEQGDVVLARGVQDLADLADQRLDAVADAALAELAEAREVAADLGRVDVRVLGQLLGGDRLPAHLARLDQHLEVAREAGRDAEREPLAVADHRLARGGAVAVRSVDGRVGHGPTVCSGARKRVAVEAQLADRHARRPRPRGCARDSARAAIVGLDVDLAQLDPERSRSARRSPPGLVAEVASGSAVERHIDHGVRARRPLVLRSASQPRYSG